jgi:hypothetical protein
MLKAIGNALGYGMCFIFVSYVMYFAFGRTPAFPIHGDYIVISSFGYFLGYLSATTNFGRSGKQ